MIQLREFYYCEHCKNLVEVLQGGGPVPVCCNDPMIKLEAKNQDEGNEKHIPVIEATEKGITVKVGSIEHPMEEKHYIKLIEVIAGDKVLRKELKPGDKPEASFCCVSESEITEVREFCTLHGLWKN